jgi:hypothetical protein
LPYNRLTGKKSAVAPTAKPTHLHPSSHPLAERISLSYPASSHPNPLIDVTIFLQWWRICS